mmetsp:Transcript_33222/g.60183  ORF Transcript_33222/g.60183 Transcript_33222/m.60183 type:complete len:456 (+) Transcript_33222:50-1417(+)
MAGQPTLVARLAAEFLGTFLLIFTVGCNVLSGNAVWGGVSIGCVLMVVIYALGGISGANFNPAVSVTLGICRSMGGPGLDWSTVAQYSAAQLAGGVSAAFGYTALFGKSVNLTPSPGFGWINACVAELAYTFMLCFVVLNVAAAKKNLQEKNRYYGLAIGFVIIAGAYGAGAVSGGCFNPAVAFSLDLSSAMLGFGYCIPYVAAELLGAALAALLFKVVRPGDYDRTPTAAAELVSEVIGTYMLILTVGLNVLAGSKAAAFSIAACLTSMIYALGDVSGAHFNPAVTLAIYASARCPDLPVGKALSYVGCQIAGAIAAAATYLFIYAGQSVPLGPVGESSWAQVAVAEVIFTFVLCYMVLCVAVSNRTKSPQMFGLVIGSCVTVGGCAIGSISGGSLNPAVSIGLSAADLHNGSNLVHALIYVMLELIGGLAAACTFQVTHAVDVAAMDKFSLAA